MFRDIFVVITLIAAIPLYPLAIALCDKDDDEGFYCGIKVTSGCIGEAMWRATLEKIT